ncbi:MAG TPA: DUF4142 domain-containing protein [Syntrophorhabdaceae bacterium]|jgi:putative membrane protein
MKKVMVLVFAFVFVFGVAVGLSAKESKFKDNSFVKDAASSGMFEVEAGKIAAEKATNSEVKNSAQRMVNDHSKVNQELMSMAEKKGALVPQKMERSHESDLEKLKKHALAEFDKEYVDMMVKEHKAAVSLFEKESKKGKDADMKAFAAKTLPTLKEHLQMWEQMAGKSKSGK